MGSCTGSVDFSSYQHVLRDMASVLERSSLLQTSWCHSKWHLLVFLFKLVVLLRLRDCPWSPPWELGWHLDLLIYESNGQGFFFPGRKAQCILVLNLQEIVWRNMVCAPVSSCQLWCYWDACSLSLAGICFQTKNHPLEPPGPVFSMHVQFWVCYGIDLSGVHPVSPL